MISGQIDDIPSCLGLVGSPLGQEATSKQFFFWAARNVLVEETQLVLCQSEIAGRTYTFHGVVDAVSRRSRSRNMDSEIDRADGDVDYVPPFESEGYTYACVSILSVTPPALTPPRERSKVYLAGEKDAMVAYGADEMGDPLSVGLIKNGGEKLAGPGMIDLDYLLGRNGGHMNVNGSAGRGTKSSFLLFMNWMLLRYARAEQERNPSSLALRPIVPIILNVKNFDLFYIDRWSTRYQPDEYLADWQALGIEQPEPFQDVSYYAPQQQGNSLPVPTRRTEGVKAYSWSLGDVIEQGLLSYLFAEVDANDANFSALVMDIENYLTIEKTTDDSETKRVLNERINVLTFSELIDWVNEQSNIKDDKDRVLRNHHSSTWKKLYRRLLRLVYESKGVLRRADRTGQPLQVTRTQTTNPQVVDLSTLASMPSLQRFVVATIFRQLVDARTGAKAVPGLVYLVTLDELNRFAPKGAKDPITQLIETVASEMRSQGIILLGAQQQASKVSEKIIENSAIRVLGRSGSLELGTAVWKFLSSGARERAANLQTNEKLVMQDTFREPMLVRVPFPAWAMNPEEASRSSENTEDEYDALIDD
jgi:uncharacterized protein